MHRIVRIVSLLAFLPIVGTIGFVVIEDWSLLDALYMAVITITTVGFEEVHTLSSAGRLFVIAYLIVGIGIFFYGAVQIGELIVRAELQEWFGRRRMDNTLKKHERPLRCLRPRSNRHGGLPTSGGQTSVVRSYRTR